MRYLIVITVSLLCLCLSCKKDNTKPSNGVAYDKSFTINNFPHHIGDTCYYHKDEMQVGYYNTTPAIPSGTLNYSCNFYTTIIADSLLPNGIIGKVWVSNESGYTVTAKQLVYYDSTLMSYIVNPIVSSYPFPLMLKVPFPQNSTWENTANQPYMDTCKTGSATSYLFNGSFQVTIGLHREFASNNAYQVYDYIIGDKGFYKIHHDESSMTGGVGVVITQNIILTKTNF